MREAKAPLCDGHYRKCHPIFHAVRGRCSPRLNNVAAPNMKMTKEVRPGMMRGTQDDPKVLIIWHPVYRHPGLIYDVTIVPSLPLNFRACASNGG
jgi:hypothetical protein